MSFCLADVDSLDSAARIDLYANIYLYALIIPAISIAGVILHASNILIATPVYEN